MVGIRRLVGDAQAEIKQQRGKNIGGGFNGVGNQRVRMTENPGDAFNQREGGVAEDAKKDDFRGRCAHRLAPPGRLRVGMEFSIKTGAYFAAFAPARVTKKCGGTAQGAGYTARSFI